MRRTLAGTVAIWLAGGALLQADEPPVNLPGVPSQPSPPNTRASGPAVMPLQPLATPTGAAIKQVGATYVDPPVPPPPPPMAAEPVVAVGATPDRTITDAGRWFGSFDYVLATMKRDPTPSLVQILPANLANFKATGGSLPPGAAQTVFGEHGIDPGDFSGIRVALGFYFDDAKCWGVDGSYFQLFQKTENYAIASPGLPVIGRDFYDVGVNADSFLRYTTPDGSSSGYIRIDSPTEMYTFDANLRVQGLSILSDRVDVLFGLRYLNLKDSIAIDSGATINSSTGAPPYTIVSHEGFAARNEFYGSQIGLDTHYRWGCFTLEFLGKLGIGWVNEQVKIDGYSTTQTGAAAPIMFPNQSILYVQPTNVGNHSRNRFAVLPEGIAKLGYQITPHIRATVGYDAMDVSSVERSGDAINTNVNPSLTKYVQVQQASTIQQPAFGFRGESWWAQGLITGLEFNY